MLRKHARLLLANENILLLVNDSTFKSPVNNISTSINDKQKQFLHNNNIMIMLYFPYTYPRHICLFIMSILFLSVWKQFLMQVLNILFLHSECYGTISILSFKCNSTLEISNQKLSCRSSRFRVYFYKKFKKENWKHNAVLIWIWDINW